MATIFGTSNNDTITPEGVSSGVTGGLPSNADDSINSGLGIDTVDGGSGNDLLIVDYSSNSYTGTSRTPGIVTSISSNGFGGFNGYYRAYYNNGFSDYDRVNFSNIERFRITGTIANDSITTGSGNDTVSGGAGNDSITTGDGNDSISGGAGDDVINPGLGVNVIDGGTGTDILVNADLSAATTALSFNETGTTAINLTGVGTISNIERFQNLTTGSGNDVISFSERFNNGTINTGSGNDSINSGLGIDTVDGGSGNDLLIVDYSSNSYTGTSRTPGIVTSISSNGFGGFNGYYRAYYNNGFSDYDRVNFSNIERFRITGTIANDSITTGSGNDTVSGGAGNDSITTGDGNDSISGGGGIDTLIGGIGNDIYIVDSTTDTITEQANQGTDTIQSSVTFSLASLSNVENLTLTGSAAINGTGNAANNIITGNSGNNTLNGNTGIDTLVGGLGNDIYVVDSTTDTITEQANQGTDTIQSSVTFSLASILNVENLILTGTGNLNGTGNTGNNFLTGNIGNNQLNGGDGNDTLNGGAGSDTLIGGLGNDTYVIDSNDIITEAANSGTDTIQANFAFDLNNVANIENLTLTGTLNINGTGTGGSNVLIGNSGNNQLNGGAGNDTLNGGAGNDILTGAGGQDAITGGAGVDRFVYQNLTDSLLANFDTITDFNATTGNDLFLVTTARSGFTSAGTVATLDATGISAKLTTANFGANFAAQFTFGSRIFVAINDATAGFNATNDAIIEVTGLTGTLSTANFVTV